VHPNGFRLGIIKGWESRWFADRNYKDLFAEDRKLRDTIRKRLYNAGISRIEIERVAGTQVGITIHTARPGIVIGKSGESVERLRADLERMLGAKKKVRLNIVEIRNPDVDAYLVAKSVAEQLEKRVSFRRAMKQAVQKAMRANAKGIKIVMGGRLGGAEIARTEKEVEGSVPLQTLRANIDYGLAEAHTTFGVIGVKVWIYHGDILPERVRTEGPQAIPQAVPAGVGGERGGPRDRGGRGGERGGLRSGDRGERGGPRGVGERGGPSGERRPRPSGGPGAGIGERRPRPVGAAGGAGERRPRPTGGPSGVGGPISGGVTTGARGTRAAASSAPDGGTGGDRRTHGAYVGEHKGPGSEREPRELPTGMIETGVGPNLPSSGPVTPSPAGEPEFPAPTANEAANPVAPAKPDVPPGAPEESEGTKGSDE
jgi:small subunit ribosomal protein S3